MGDTSVTVADPLVVRGVIFGLLARLLSADVEPLASGTGVAELREAFSRLDDQEALAALARTDELEAFDEHALVARQVRLFEKGRVAPYETSHVRAGPTGHMAALADVAGFYRAFGMHVTGERPDHCVAELEFASLVTLGEAHCRHEGDDEGAEVYAQAARTFVRDHLGGWLDVLAAKLVAADPDGPYGPIVEAAARFVTAEASRRHVIPVRPASLFAADDLGEDDDDDIVRCGGDAVS